MAAAVASQPLPTVVAAPAPAAKAARPPVNKWLVTVSITFGTLMGAIDASIVNVALEHIRGTVGATIDEITWISTGFAIATVLVMPLTAFLGRLFGQKRVYMISLVIFLVGSALCGLARSLTTLVIFRAIQGFGAGALQPTEQAILRQTFPPKEQGMAMALFALAIMVGPAVGPTLGGYIVDNYAWPWIFYINLPVGALGLFMVSSFVHEPDDVREANKAAAAQQRKHMDWWGIALLSMGLAGLQYVLEEGNRNDWFQSPMILMLTIGSVVLLVAFVIRELTAPVPAVNLTLFKDRVYTAGTLIGALMFAMLMSVTFLLPVFMQELLGFNATQSGLALMPRTLVMMVCIPIVGRLYNKIDPRISVFAGLSFLALAVYMMSHYTLATTAGGVISSLLVQGLGFSFMMVPLNTVALATIPRHKMTDATGLNSLLRQIGGSFGLAIFATQLSRFQVVARASLASHVTATNPIAQQRLSMIQGGLMARGLDAATSQVTAVGALAGSVAQQAAVLAFSKLFMVGVACFVAVMPLVFFLKQPKDAAPPSPGEHAHVEV
ncbi:MAG: DHA2 family efflux MFS transporter permease subunit [Deltaproteobacteria bacterium]|nr:DHA2 family efflux MFS transporter permease subunit [Deltaproteobacteria bacterium]